jgi:hypothetical protein
MWRYKSGSNNPNEGEIMSYSIINDSKLFKEKALISLIHDHNNKDPENAFIVIEGIRPGMVQYYELIINPETRVVNFVSEDIIEKKFRELMKGKDCYAISLSVSTKQAINFDSIMLIHGMQAKKTFNKSTTDEKNKFFLLNNICSSEEQRSAYSWSRKILFKLDVAKDYFDAHFIPETIESFVTNTNHIHNPSCKDMCSIS